MDSGCTINALPTSLADRMDLAVETVDPSTYDICNANSRKVNIIGKTDDTSAQLAGWSDSELLPLLVSDTLTGDEILVLWETGLRWGFLNFPPGVVSASHHDGTIIKGMGPEPVMLREENTSFLANLPPWRSYSPVDPSDKMWNSKMVEAGKEIRDDLLDDYQLALKRLGDVDTFADVEPAMINVD